MQRAPAKLTKLYLGAAILVLTGTSSILAGNILASPSKIVEFGAGEYLIKSCNTWLTLNIIPGVTGTKGAPPGFSPLEALEIRGIDTSKCRGTRLTIKSESKSEYSLPLLRSDSESTLCSQGQCGAGSHVSDSFAIDITQNGLVQLEGQDQYKSLQFDSTANAYFVHFARPAALAAEAQNFIIQSQDLSSH